MRNEISASQAQPGGHERLRLRLVLVPLRLVDAHLLDEAESRVQEDDRRDHG